MLKKIPTCISPLLMKTLMDMGHGDEIVIADGNFPAEEYAKRIVRLDGKNIPEILEAILRFVPLDKYVQQPVALMQTVGDDKTPEIWKTYEDIIKNSEEAHLFKSFEHVERYDFYERAKKAYAVIATSESAVYANVIIKKGVVVI